MHLSEIWHSKKNDSRLSRTQVIRAYAGDENAIKNFDLGGFLVTVYRLITDTKYIQKIKEEFIFNEWDRIIESKNNIFNI